MPDDTKKTTASDLSVAAGSRIGAPIWTGNKELDRLRSKAAASPTGCITVSIGELNKILPIRYDNTEHRRERSEFP